MLNVGLGVGGILADDVDGSKVASLHRFEHEGEVEPRIGIQFRAVHRFELGAGRGVIDVLESRKFVWQGAHVPAALDVVLATKRHEAGPPATDVASE